MHREKPLTYKGSCDSVSLLATENGGKPEMTTQAERAQENRQIASTILEQMGGNRLRVMTGAKNFLALDRGLSFRIPGKGFAKQNINHIRIMLNGNDLYDVTFQVIRGTTVKTVAEVSDVFCEDLQRIFRHHTGLDTHL